jgi:hypothetical protein
LTTCGGRQEEENPLIDVHAEGTGLRVDRPKVPKPATVFLGEGASGPITYGGDVVNQGTTKCGLVILHTDDAQAVGYHWPFCRKSADYEAAFERAKGSRVGTSIEVVVNGGRYSPGDSSLKEFGLYLHYKYRLPVAAYRQVDSSGSGSDDQDPWVVVEHGGVSPGMGFYRLEAVPL